MMNSSCVSTVATITYAEMAKRTAPPPHQQLISPHAELEVLGKTKTSSINTSKTATTNASNKVPLVSILRRGRFAGPVVSSSSTVVTTHPTTLIFRNNNNNNINATGDNNNNNNTKNIKRSINIPPQPASETCQTAPAAITSPTTVITPTTIFTPITIAPTTIAPPPDTTTTFSSMLNPLAAEWTHFIRKLNPFAAEWTPTPTADEVAIDGFLDAPATLNPVAAEWTPTRTADEVVIEIIDDDSVDYADAPSASVIITSPGNSIGKMIVRASDDVLSFIASNCCEGPVVVNHDTTTKTLKSALKDPNGTKRAHNPYRLSKIMFHVEVKTYKIPYGYNHTELFVRHDAVVAPTKRLDPPSFKRKKEWASTYWTDSRNRSFSRFTGRRVDAVGTPLPDYRELYKGGKASDLIIILGMDELLIHCHENDDKKVCSADMLTSKGGGMHIINRRPGLDLFLKELTSKYKVHIFTDAKSRDYADAVLNYLCNAYGDGDMFAGRWYRDDCTFVPQHNFYAKKYKTLSDEFPPGRTFLVDNKRASFWPMSYGLKVDNFYDDDADCTLPLVAKFIVNEMDPAPDVRTVLATLPVLESERGFCLGGSCTHACVPVVPPIFRNGNNNNNNSIANIPPPRASEKCPIAPAAIKSTTISKAPPPASETCQIAPTTITPATITPINGIPPPTITPTTIITPPVVKDIIIKNDTKKNNYTKKTLKSALKQPNGRKRPAKKNIMEAIPEHLNTESYQLYRNNLSRRQIKFSDHVRWIVFDPAKGIANNKQVHVLNEVIAYLDQERRGGRAVWFQQQMILAEEKKEILSEKRKKILADQATTSTTVSEKCPTAPPAMITITAPEPRFRSDNNNIIINVDHIPTIPPPPPPASERCSAAPQATIVPPPILTTVPSPINRRPTSSWWLRCVQLFFFAILIVVTMHTISMSSMSTAPAVVFVMKPATSFTAVAVRSSSTSMVWVPPFCPNVRSIALPSVSATSVEVALRSGEVVEKGAVPVDEQGPLRSWWIVSLENGSVVSVFIVVSKPVVIVDSIVSPSVSSTSVEVAVWSSKAVEKRAVLVMASGPSWSLIGLESRLAMVSGVGDSGVLVGQPSNDKGVVLSCKHPWTQFRWSRLWLLLTRIMVTGWFQMFPEPADDDDDNNNNNNADDDDDDDDTNDDGDINDDGDDDDVPVLPAPVVPAPVVPAPVVPAPVPAVRTPAVPAPAIVPAPVVPAPAPVVAAPAPVVPAPAPVVPAPAPVVLAPIVIPAPVIPAPVPAVRTPAVRAPAVVPALVIPAPAPVVPVPAPVVLTPVVQRPRLDRECKTKPPGWRYPA